MKLCRICRAVNESPIRLSPGHLVHPEHGKPMVYDVRSRAKCPDCGTLWYRGTDNFPVIVAARR